MDLNWSLIYCARVYVNADGLFTFICNECTVQFSSGTELERHVRAHLNGKNRKTISDSGPDQIGESTHVQSNLWNSTTKVEQISEDESLDDRLSVHSMSDYKEEQQVELCEPVDEENEENLRQMDANVFFEGDDQPIERRKRTAQRKRQDLKVFQCDICQKKFKEKYNLKVHMNVHMRVDDIPRCTICKKKVKDLQRHMVQHETGKSHKCDQCDASYNTSSKLKNHYKKHSAERPFLCFKCGLAYATRSDLTHHMKKHNDVKRFSCDHCGFSFRERFKLRDHIEHAHSGKRPYTCETCNNSFSSKKALRQHKNLHMEKKFACKFCELKFSQGAGRRNHEKRAHGAM